MKVLVRCFECGEFTQLNTEDPRPANLNEWKLDVILRAWVQLARCPAHKYMPPNDLELFMEPFTGVTTYGFRSIDFTTGLVRDATFARNDLPDVDAAQEAQQ